MVIKRLKIVSVSDSFILPMLPILLQNSLHALKIVLVSPIRTTSSIIFSITTYGKMPSVLRQFQWFAQRSRVLIFSFIVRHNGLNNPMLANNIEELEGAIYPLGFLGFVCFLDNCVHYIVQVRWKIIP